MNLANIINTILGGSKLSGLRTIIANTILLIIALWDFLSKTGGLFEMLCDTGLGIFMSFCNITESSFYLTAVIIITALNNVLRWVTVSPVGVEASPAELKFAHAAPDGKQKFANVIAVASIAVILALIAYLIF